jgi:AraC-like DNA-binding protein
MLAQNILTLKLVRLNSDDSWSFKQDGLCVVLARAGAGHYAIGSVIQPFAPGDVLVVKGPASMRLHTATRAELIFSCFALRLEHLYPLFAGPEISRLEGLEDSLHQPRHFPAALPLAKQCHRLIEEVPPQANLDHRSQLLRVISLILTEEFKTVHERRAGTLGVEEHLLQIFERLSADELLTVSVGDLAAKFNCSRRHLNRLFHQYFGFSVASLRMEMRLLKAVSLLRDANAKIINVAEQCGFNHLGLFNTCFKRRFGVSPGQWRKQALQADTPTTTAPPADSACPLHSKGLCPLTGATPEIGDATPTVPTAQTVSSLLPPGLARSSAGSFTPNAKISATALSALSHNGGTKMTL